MREVTSSPPHSAQIDPTQPNTIQHTATQRIAAKDIDTMGDDFLYSHLLHYR